MIRILSLKAEPSDEVYRGLLDYSLTKCIFALLVVRRNLGLTDPGKRLLNDLEPFLDAREETSTWPGTQLIGQTAIVCRFKLVRASVSILQNAANRLFEWRQPALPEDLCLMRQADDPWLVSISHENDAYLRASESEWKELCEVLPGIDVSVDSRP